MKNLWIKPEDQLPNIGEQILLFRLIGKIKIFEIGTLACISDYGTNKILEWKVNHNWGDHSVTPIAWQPLEAPEFNEQTKIKL